MSEPNLEEMSVEQLRELALQHSDVAPQPEAEPEEKPRDDKGRSAKPAPAAEEEEEAEETVFERVIDIGAGAGAQVFRGKSLEELVNNLAKAQENATRKIREQAAELKTKKEAVSEKIEASDDLTDEQKYILQQRMLTDPMAVIKEFVNKEVSQLTQAQEAARQQREDQDKKEFDEAKRWAESNPDYVSTERNAKRLLRWLELEKVPVSAENLQKAFEDLNESGLLEVKPEEKQEDNAEASDEVQPERIARKAETTVVKRKVVGGLSAKRSAPAPAQNTPEPTEADIEKMTTAELHAYALKAAMAQ
jgi:hypothetical protein